MLQWNQRIFVLNTLLKRRKHLGILFILLAAFYVL